MRPARILRPRACAPRLAILAVAATTIATAVPAHAATNVQGTIVVAGEGNGQLWGCGPCTPSLTVGTAGYVAGLDGTTPFTVSWGTPGVALMPASMSLVITENCSGPLPNSLPYPPTIGSVSGTITINGAVLLYNGVQMNAVVTGQFSAQPVSDAILVISLGLTAQSGSVSVSIDVLEARGLLNLIPASDFLCPNPPEPTTFAVNGTLLTAA